MSQPIPTQGRYDRAVSAFIDEFWRKHYRSPSIREIQSACGISSSSVAQNTIRRIARQRGDKLANDGSARGITPRWVIQAIQTATPNGGTHDPH